MAEALTLENCDLDCGTNNRSHHTADAGCTRLIVRRGQAFEIKLQFSPRGYEEGVDQLTLFAQTGPCPSEDFGTEAKIKVTDSLQEGEWSAAISNVDGENLVLSVISPPDARIGKYALSLETSTGTEENSCNLGDFFLLFNPWCPEDSVYMENDAERTEYVATQYGIIFQGVVSNITSVPWNFGQFEDDILEASLEVLDKNPKFLEDSTTDCTQRNDPVYISRVVSAMVNCNGDSGVLYGRWDNCYGDGVSPMSWIGSVDILRRWRKFGCQAVKYGQCWVYAAVACSVLRCLGIPARVITNYNSAHDTNSNLAIELYLDDQGKNQKKHKDMIWNFHCWVEAWMNRLDLPEGYDGWQVVDPTPQEKSDGAYCCGPAPVLAVKEGDLAISYDVPFVFAEVNADVIYFVEQRDGTVRQTKNNALVGQKISTKAVGTDTREDITQNYKYPEGSEDERRVFEKANQQVIVPRSQREEAPHAIDMKIKVSEKMDKGSDFDVFAVISNNTEEDKICRLMFCARPTSYMGEVGPECGMKDLVDLKLEANAEKSVPLRVLYEKYGSTLTQDNMIKVVALLTDNSTKDVLLAIRDINVKNPDIKVRVLGEPKQQKKLVAEISVKNPLSEPLSGCSFTLEGAGLTDQPVVKELESPIEPGQDAKVRVDLVPQLSGLRKLVVDFESDHLTGVKGYKNIIIAPLPK
ncbi:protein-glutamine gamma-glutamyltransferase 2 isoform X2 [Hyla sarda]|uniref:protein-glutamine gamma-glutamyltransferase 2 isoform X2 n=1 Tax=Hyla sarda TaxID=327740 RepID=UPI0024C23E59|nr:protein-glutamine gamma-glutamyltransferase 2 isoform X2 [Hyla sarda]